MFMYKLCTLKTKYTMYFKLYREPYHARIFRPHDLINNYQLKTFLKTVCKSFQPITKGNFSLRKKKSILVIQKKIDLTQNQFYTAHCLSFRQRNNPIFKLNFTPLELLLYSPYKMIVPFTMHHLV